VFPFFTVRCCTKFHHNAGYGNSSADILFSFIPKQTFITTLFKDQEQHLEAVIAPLEIQFWRHLLASLRWARTPSSSAVIIIIASLV
jgi:hypothetical protein